MKNERHNEQARNWYWRNHEKFLAICKTSYAKKRDQRIATMRRYYERNRETSQEYFRSAYRLNRQKYITRARMREIALTMAMPSWAKKSDIIDIYNQAQRRSLIKGIKYHVDHVYPLRHPRLCGLHVSWNLQIITAKKNMTKSNKVVL